MIYTFICTICRKFNINIYYFIKDGSSKLLLKIDQYTKHISSCNSV